MCPPETALARRVDIFLFVSVLVVKAMVSGPPQDALLPRTLCQKCQKKLPTPSKLVGSMTEITVISSGDAEHPHHIRRKHAADQRPAERNEEHSSATCMQKQERNDRPETITA